MKKLFLVSIAVLTAFAMIACEWSLPTAETGANPNDIPSVQYTADSSALTLNLDGGSNRALSRALSDSLAKSGYDFFEVVFYDGTDIARASWEIGQSAGIRNVPRGAAGVGIDYASTNPDDATGGDGAAILLIGRKSDKSLLAVGKLTAVDSVDGNTTILPSSRTATFTVTSLVAGTQVPGTATADQPTFYTNALDTDESPEWQYTSLKTASITVSSKAYSFPLYILPLNENVAATYTISCTDATNLADYFAGIRVYGNGASGNVNKYAPKDPRFPIGGGSYGYFPEPYADPTISFENNDTAGGAFENVIEFAIATGTTDGLIAFAFEIPVYGIIVASQANAGVPDAVTWRIKPGYQTNYYDLDDGTSDFVADGPAGGTILLGIGVDFEQSYMGIIATGDIEYP